MHRDDLVCTLSIDPLSGSILRVSKPIHPELLPLGGCIDAATLRKWWQRRAVPISQGRMKHILNQLNLTTPQEYLVKNLGLSLTDHYWIKPLELDLNWDNINLFTNDFRDPVGDMQMEEQAFHTSALPKYAFSPSSSTQGDLKKKWIISKGARCLVKGSHGSNAQQSLNEVVASTLHQKQDRHPFVTYSILNLSAKEQLCCICESFTSDSIEFIPAIDVVESRKKDNATSMYEHFIAVCASHGLAEKVVRHFLEYQILSDFILTNTDRHLNNFGVLRDTNTLQFIAMAPIFDTGNSMFWDTPTLPMHSDLTDIRVNSFRQTEMKLLQLVQGTHLLDVSKLPTVDELRHIYEMDPLIPRLDTILLGYQKKIDLLLSHVKT